MTEDQIDAKIMQEFREGFDRAHIQAARVALTKFRHELRAAGYEVAPVEPTEAMLEAGRKAVTTGRVVEIYRAMLAASEGQS